jgi:hypothetical protein
VVSVRQTIDSQRSAANTVRELQQQFASDSRVQFKFVDNTGTAAREIADRPEAKDYAESRRQLNDILDSEYREGRISKDIWEKIRGSEVD